MTSKKEETNNPAAPRKRRTPTPSFSASQKAQAVLAVWTERAKPAEVVRELKINWMVLQHWQRRAMEGMLQALESRVNLSQGQVLSPRLQSLLANRQRKMSTDKIASRLEQIQLASKESSAAKPQ